MAPTDDQLLAAIDVFDAGTARWRTPDMPTFRRMLANFLAHPPDAQQQIARVIGAVVGDALAELERAGVLHRHPWNNFRAIPVLWFRRCLIELLRKSSCLT